MPDPYDFALEAARAAGERLMAYFGRALQIHFKESYNPCSEADIAANDNILAALAGAFPTHSILSEESAPHSADPDHLWVVDPLDGTNNFIHNVPHFGVSLAYYHRGRAEAGVVYQPCTDQMFSARRGGGAFLNGSPISCPPTASLDKALIGVGFYYDRGQMMIRTLEAVRCLFERQIHGIRRFGCASLDLCYVASGCFDAFFEYSLSPWDFAAGRLLVEEAGGCISNCQGQPLALERSSLLAATAGIYDEVQEAIRRFDPAACRDDSTKK